MTVDIRIGGEQVSVDLGRLTPTARDLARAVADHPARATVDIWVEADAPIRDTTPDWEHWYTPQEAARPLRRAWRGWSDHPLNGDDPHERLEHEATKIPPGWHVLGARPDLPLSDAGPVREATAAQVVEFLAARGRVMTAVTFRAYVSRGLAPARVRVVGRTPVWDLDEVAKWDEAGGMTRMDDCAGGGSR